jgi:hypothetical protein
MHLRVVTKMDKYDDSVLFRLECYLICNLQAGELEKVDMVIAIFHDRS